jgi:hypothetical protein
MELPNDVYDARRVMEPPAVGWAAEPYGLPSVELGDDWAVSNSPALFDTPSVIIETNGMCSLVRSMRTRPECE